MVQEVLRGQLDGGADSAEGEGGLGGGDSSAEPLEQSLGTGFILWEDGYIVTNRHVVKDAKQIIARLSDRRQLPATVIGMDERSDLALLKIDATDLPAVKLGDIGKLRVGEWCWPSSPSSSALIIRPRRIVFGQGPQPDFRAACAVHPD